MAQIKVEKPNYKPDDPRWEIEHILCERITLVPELNAGPIQYLIKYKHYEFHDCYWVHERSIFPLKENTPLSIWKQLDQEQKFERYRFLNEPIDFMELNDLEKRKIGWKYVQTFDLEIFTQTPESSSELS